MVPVGWSGEISSKSSHGTGGPASWLWDRHAAASQIHVGEKLGAKIVGIARVHVFLNSLIGSTTAPIGYGTGPSYRE
jgi:hypothetical protein